MTDEHLGQVDPMRAEILGWRWEARVDSLITQGGYKRGIRGGSGSTAISNTGHLNSVIRSC